MLKKAGIIGILLLAGCAGGADEARNKPALVHRVDPVYPVVAYTSALSGYVRVQYDVNADGKVAELRILDSKPRYLFDESVVRSMAQWQFEKGKPFDILPALKDGDSYSVQTGA